MQSDERQHDSGAGPGDADQYLTFLLGGETYGVNITGIQEIIEYDRVTHVPMVPDYIRGVLNLRGRVVPVIDLSARLGRQPSTVGKLSCIVIIDVRQPDSDQVFAVGILVDMVNEVRDIPAADVEPAPNFGARIRTDFILGMAPHEDGFMVLLAIGRVLSIDELALLEEVASQDLEDAPAD